ncbi:hypothetical protein BGW36DRAFT_6772 [Talaromyces proteolyticus]|uniref:C2H2-type domain-containing protein n=1 Tax=Talaromyces proteolyticus TaxID=1131652 RepID=A0AAD4Q5Z0_9EURO|nr:uncharacterized protein BGW36DRAFT_6772 [Talaromyces proteolyticus]KAH8705088.1 hypothetical protein BGW36DRAFT_6772 [Talaromyces proteolyticus]
MDTPKAKDEGRRKASTSLKCAVCQATFRRPEHLKRHLRSHTKEKPFQCNQCSRRFSRSDTLHRHEQSHHTPGAQGKLDYAHRITVKTFRACFECATARVRCSGGDTCSRCQSRTIRCQYPTERRSKSKKSHGPPTILIESQPNSSNSPEQSLTALVLQGSVTSGSPPSEQQVSQQLQFRFITYDAGSQGSTPDQQETPRSSTEQIAKLSDSIVTVESQPQDFPERPLNNPLFSYSYVENSSRVFSQDIKSSFQMTSLNNFSVSQDVQPIDPQIQGGDISIDNSPLDITFEQNLCQQDPSSALNWLPSDLLKNSWGSFLIDEDHLNQSFQQWWPEGFETDGTWLPPIPFVDHVTLFDDSEQQSLNNIPPVDSPETHSSISQDGSVFSESNDESICSGEYYVDGEGARYPKYSRSRNIPWETTRNLISLPRSQRNAKESSYVSFPQTHDIRMSDSCFIEDKHIFSGYL